MKKTCNTYLSVFLIFILLSSYSSSQTIKFKTKTFNNKKYISLFEFIETFNINNSFDIISERGKLFYKGSIAIYQIGFSIILVDGLLKKSEYPVIREKGEILFPIEFVEYIIYKFYPHLSIRRKENDYLLYQKDKFFNKKITTKYKKDKIKKIPSDISEDMISFIIIDPGHGGKDPGAIGRRDSKEKWITLKVAKILKSYLEKRLSGIKIKLTRKADNFLTLEKRTDIANSMLKSNSNGIFVSIHVNASISHNISGFETYFLSQTPTNEEARATAALENNVIILENKSSYDDVEYIEAIMLTTQIQKESSMLAACIQRGMDKKIWESKSKGVKKADFFVLRGALMPAVLIEIGFITNKKEADLLKKSSYKKKIAKGIGEGIIIFIQKYNRMIKKK